MSEPDIIDSRITAAILAERARIVAALRELASTFGNGAGRAVVDGVVRAIQGEQI